MTERMGLLHTLADRQPVTHSCPTCGGPVSCEVERGKSACWCFGLQSKEIERGDRCVCRCCLTDERQG